ncbi:MerR family transcriptional regulator [Cellulomonas gilvus]|uniref:Transcriptional regulator HTH-type FeoC domain-containing protein n=1 Tax=Cellulomonas gilvus (strain ATCC 13127 / NRRL B-14078) TaxID=593907 RepID=F8A4P5_CELGA|nr:hypothetical protein [Cellulomonas gilvus]AEI10861.1 hypothetical protein Celgi_0339 [Cellulomonas gilvus ATCC 13127]
MSVLDDVLRETRAGGTVDGVARTLGLDAGLVVAALDHWERRGVLLPARPAAGDSCRTCVAPERAAARPLACAGCPLARA